MTSEEKISELESRIQALWTLVRTLFLLTQSTTKIDQEKINKLVRAWKNQAPPDQLLGPLYHALDLAAVDMMPHVEDFLLDLAERLPPTRPERDQ